MRHSTQTTLGEIPHIAIHGAGGVRFHAPVKVVIEPEDVELGFAHRRILKPLMAMGKLVFALPGNRELYMKLEDVL